MRPQADLPSAYLFAQRTGEGEGWLRPKRVSAAGMGFRPGVRRAAQTSADRTKRRYEKIKLLSSPESWKTSSVSLSAATPFTLEGGYKGKCDTSYSGSLLARRRRPSGLPSGQLSHGSRIPNSFWNSCSAVWTRTQRFTVASKCQCSFPMTFGICDLCDSRP